MRAAWSSAVPRIGGIAAFAAAWLTAATAAATTAAVTAAPRTAAPRTAAPAGARPHERPGATRPRPLGGDVEELPPGPVKRALFDLRADAMREGVDQGLIARPMAEAVRAMARAMGARASGDEPHAVMLEGLATGFVELGSLTVRAIAREQAMKALAARVEAAAIKLARARALVAEEAARRGRLTALVERAERKAMDGRANDGRANDGRANDGKANDGKANDGKANDGRANDGKANDGRATERVGK